MEKNKKRDRKEYQRLYYIKNRERKLAARKKYYEENKEKCLEIGRICNAKNFQKNKEKINKQRRVYRNSNVQFRIRESLRKNFRHFINGKNKTYRFVDLLGCSLDEFRLYIQSKFRDGMSWDNYGFRGWHIDHIIPCSSFDFTDKEQQKKCFHYTNMQPLWWRDNIIKSNKVHG